MRCDIIAPNARSRLRRTPNINLSRASFPAMSEAATLAPERYAQSLQRAETLAERGAVAPFVTPALQGARLRLVESRYEVVIPAPWEGGGALILGWTGAANELQAATADRRLVAALRRAPPTPGAIRRAALEVAAEGLHGRAAARAAEAASEADVRHRALLEPRLERIILGGRALAPIFFGAGLAGAEGGPALRMLARVTALAEGLAGEQEIARLPEDRALAKRLQTACDAAVASATRLVGAAQALGDDVPILLADPRQHPEAAAVAERPFWALNGLDLLAAFWEATPSDRRRDLLRLGPRLAAAPAAEMLRWPGMAEWRSPPVLDLPRFDQSFAEAALAAWLAP